MMKTNCCFFHLHNFRLHLSGEMSAFNSMNGISFLQLCIKMSYFTVTNEKRNKDKMFFFPLQYYSAGFRVDGESERKKPSLGSTAEHTYDCMLLYSSKCSIFTIICYATVAKSRLVFIWRIPHRQLLVCFSRLFAYFIMCIAVPNLHLRRRQTYS